MWRASARDEGTRARDRLRGGFEEAILALGQGFLAHPANQAIRKALHEGALTKKAYFGELLRLAYRLIFLLAIEERGLLHPKDTARDAEERYALGYSVKRLQDLLGVTLADIKEMVDAQEMLRELRAQYRPEAGVEEKRRQLTKAIDVVQAQYVIVKQKCEQMEEMKGQLEERLKTFERWMKELDRLGEKEAVPS